MNAFGKWLVNAATSYVVGSIVDTTVTILVPLVRYTIVNVKAQIQGHPGYVEVPEDDPLTENMSKYVNKNEAA